MRPLHYEIYIEDEDVHCKIINLPVNEFYWSILLDIDNEPPANSRIELIADGVQILMALPTRVFLKTGIPILEDFRKFSGVELRLFAPPKGTIRVYTFNTELPMIGSTIIDIEEALAKLMKGRG